MLQRALTLVLVVLLAMAAGCASMGGSGGGSADMYSYNEGKVVREFAASLDETLSATLAAAEDKGLDVISNEKANGEALVRAMAESEVVSIRLESLDSSKTKVAIRLGMSGNRRWSKQVHESIAGHL